MSTIVTDPGDAAAQLCHGLSSLSNPLLDDLADQVKSGKGELAKLKERMAARVRSTGRLPAGITMVKRGPALAILMALDEVLGDLDPSRSGPVPTAMAYLRARLTGTGQLDTGAFGGAMLVRHTFSGEPGGETDGLAGVLTSLIQVHADAWARVTLRRPLVDPLMVSARRDGLQVSMVPFYAARSDVVLSARPGKNLPWYCAVPAPRLDRVGRVRAALDALDGSGAVLGLVPELTLDEATLAAWVGAMQTTDVGGSLLRWVLVGTGAVAALPAGDPVHGTGRDPLDDLDDPDDPDDLDGKADGRGVVNRAVLMDRLTGEVVLTQDKQHGFTLTALQVSEWGLAPELKQPVAHAEWLDNSDKVLHLLDTAHGRFAILICEDLSRSLSMGALAAALGVAVVLVPIFGATILPAPAPILPAPAPILPGPPVRPGSSWAHDFAAQIAVQVGTRLVVVNSLAISRSYQPEPGTVANTTLFTVAPARPPVRGYGVTLIRGEPRPGLDTLSLSADDDAVTARTAHVGGEDWRAPPCSRAGSSTQCDERSQLGRTNGRGSQVAPRAAITIISRARSN